VKKSLVDSEIFHAVKIGTLSFVLEPQNKYLVFVIAFSLTLIYLLLLTLVYYIHLHLLFDASIILILSVFTLLIKKEN